MKKANSDAFHGVRALIQQKMVEESLPSIAVAVARNGEILWEEGFGWADREQRIPATEHTLYSLASISKPITATGLMVLLSQGKLDLDRPLNDYLGDAKVTARVGNAEDATVRRVANHTSGLPMHYQFFYADEPYQRPPMDETIRRYANLITPPGERHCYSNLGFGILDYVISRLSGKPYADFMREEVFLPLGMTRSSVDIGPGLEPYQALRYGGDGVPYPFYDFDHPGGSAVYCSAHDLVRFGMFHLKQHLSDQRPILSDELIDAMQTPAPDSKGNFGVGWATNDDKKGYRAISHGGGMGGVSTSLHLLPSEGLVVAVLCNKGSGFVYGLNDEIFSALLPDYAARREAEKAKPPEDKTPEPAFVPDAKLRGEWKGTIHTYQGDIPFTLWFQKSGDVHAQVGSQLKSLVNDVRFQEDSLTGQMLSTLDTEDAVRRPHLLQLDLKLRGRVLNGAVYALTILPHGEGGAPGKRLGNGLSHWTELAKAN